MREWTTWTPGHSLHLQLHVLCYTELPKYVFKKPHRNTEMCLYLLTTLKTLYLILYSFLESSSFEDELKHKEKQHSVIQSCSGVLQQREIAINTSSVSRTVGTEYQMNTNSV